LIVVFLISWAIWGYEEGFFLGIVELVGFSSALIVSTLGYPLVGSFIYKITPLPRGVANLFAFLSILSLYRTLYWAIVPLTFKQAHYFLTKRRWARAEHMAGVIPAVATGLIWTVLIVSILSWFPFSQFFQQEINRSHIGSFIAKNSSFLEPKLERLLRPAATDLIVFFSVEKKDSEKLDFPKDLSLKVDTAAETEMLNLVNKERIRNGLAPLILDVKLREVARAHSMEMFRLGYFGHNSPVKGSPFDRMRQAGIKFFVAGENLAYAQNVYVAHTGLMESPDHRENILSPFFHRIGIGVVNAGLYGEMFTQEFTD
jgi:uncharacterized protein YkwD